MDILTIRISEKMRYATSGDYYSENGKNIIDVFDQGDPDKNFLIAMHEIVEQYLCQTRGITFGQIDKFDFEYENNRSEDDTTSEPGDHPDCPYKDEHRFAMIIEQIIAHELGVDWQDHDKNIKVYEPNA